MRYFWLLALLLPVGLCAQLADRATPTFKAFTTLGVEQIRPNRALNVFEFGGHQADAHIPSVVGTTKKTAPKAEAKEEKQGEKFIHFDIADQKKAAYGQRLRQSERAYFEQVRQRKQEYYKQIDSRSLLAE